MQEVKKNMKHRTVLEYLQEIKIRGEHEICSLGATHKTNETRKVEKQDGNIWS